MTTSDDPDRPLVDEARAGSERAMEQLFRRHAPAIYAYLLRSAQDASAAEDLAQETFIRAFRSIARFDGRSTFRTWLFAIAINRARTHQSRGAGPRTVELKEESAMAEQPARSPWTQKRLEQALGQLPDGYKDAVIMHDVLELEHEEIAKLRGCTVGTSKSQLHKARAKLRALLGPREEIADA
jgi:RNA polymerase sigma-70 factor (ECF subfamily)